MPLCIVADFIGTQARGRMSRRRRLFIRRYRRGRRRSFVSMFLVRHGGRSCVREVVAPAGPQPIVRGMVVRLGVEQHYLVHRVMVGWEAIIVWRWGKERLMQAKRRANAGKGSRLRHVGTGWGRSSSRRVLGASAEARNAAELPLWLGTKCHFETFNSPCTSLSCGICLSATNKLHITCDKTLTLMLTFATANHPIRHLCILTSTFLVHQ